MADLHLAADHVDGFVDAAEALGSQSWMPIVAMAEHAMEVGDPRTAVAVFDAADQPGFHQALLAKRRAALCSGPDMSLDH